MTEVYCEELLRQQAKTVHLLFHVIEAPGALFRDMETRLPRTLDCAQDLKQMLAHARNDHADIHLISSTVLDALPEQVSSLSSFKEHAFCEKIDFNAKRGFSAHYERRQIGETFQSEVNIRADGQRIDATLKLGLHPGLPTERAMKFFGNASGEWTGIATTDFQIARLDCTTALLTGTSKLLGVIPRPAVLGEAADDRLWGVFVSARVLPIAKNALVPVPASLTEGMMKVKREMPPGLFQYATAPPRSAAMERFVEGQAPAGSAPAKRFEGPLPSFLERQGIPHEGGSRFEIEGSRLLIENTPANIERIDAMLYDLKSRTPKSSQFLIQIIEAPEKLLQDLAASAHERFDHSEEWQRLSDAMKGGQATLIDTLWGENHAASTSTFLAAREHGYIDGMALDETGHPSLVLKRQSVGPDLRIETDEKAIPGAVRAKLNLNLDSMPGVQRRTSFRIPATQTEIDLPFTDFHQTRFDHPSAFLDNGTKILGIWQPPDRPDLREKGLQHVAVIRHHQVAHIVPPKSSDHAKTGGIKDPKAWETRQFRVPLDFLYTMSSSVIRFPLGTAHGISVSEFFSYSGVLFREGAAASFEKDTNTLTVKNTVENLDIIEMLVDELARQGPKTIRHSLHVLEAPASVIRGIADECLPLTDHREPMKRLLGSVGKGGIRILSSARIDCVAGGAAESRQTTEHTHVVGLGTNQDGSPKLKTERREVGLVFRVEPTIRQDGDTAEMHLKMRFDTAPPAEHLEHVTDPSTGRRTEVPLTDFHRVEITNSLTMVNGTARLIGLWRDTSKNAPSTLQIAFLTCDIVPVEK